MNVRSAHIEKPGQFHDVLCMEFEQRGRWVRKKKPLHLLDQRTAILKAVREAERDFAWKEHGEKWRDHVGPFFSADTTEEEDKLLEQALGLLA